MTLETFENGEFGVSVREKLNDAIVALNAVTGDLTGFWSAEAVLIGKTIDGGANTITGLLLSAFASGIVDTDPTLAADSDSRIATQQAVRAFVLASLGEVADALSFAGVVDASADPDYPAADLGQTFRVTAAGKVGGIDGVDVEEGDLLICLGDDTPAGDHATVGSSWTSIHTSADGGVTGPPSSTPGHVARFADASGSLLKDGGPLVASDIADASAAGRALLTAATVSEQRALLGIAGAGAGTEVGDVRFFPADPGAGWLRCDGRVLDLDLPGLPFSLRTVTPEPFGPYDIGAGTNAVRGILHAGGIFLVYGAGGLLAAAPTLDGPWQAIITGRTTTFTCAAYHNGLFVLGEETATNVTPAILVTDDPFGTWAQLGFSPTLTTYDITAMAAGDGGIVFGSWYNSGKSTSVVGHGDLTNLAAPLTVLASPAAGAVSTIGFGEGVWLYNHGSILRSKASFAAVPTTIEASWYGAAKSFIGRFGSRWLFGGVDGTILLKGSVFDEDEPVAVAATGFSPTQSIMNVIPVGDAFYACGSGGVVSKAAALDGPWEAVATGVTAELRGLATDGAYVLAVGLGGTVLRSTIASGFVAPRVDSQTQRADGVTPLHAYLKIEWM